MTIEVALLLTGVGVIFGIYNGIANLKRNNRKDHKSDITQMTTVLMKLDTISEGIVQIRKEINDNKNDTKENWKSILNLRHDLDDLMKDYAECSKEHRTHMKGGYTGEREN